MKFIIFVVLLFGTASLILLSGLTFPTRIALLVLILAVLSDFFTTWRCLRKKGREGNPMVALMFKKVGLYKSFGILAGIWICFIIFRWLPSGEGPQTAIALVYWLVPMNNLMVLAKLNKKA